MKNAICNPKPIQKPHPPIMIGGGGEKYTLRIAAEIGNIWDRWGASIEEYTRKVRILQQHCDDLGRKMDDIELSWSGPFLIGKDKGELNKKIRLYGGESSIFCTYDNCIEVLQKYIDLGCQQFVFVISGFNDEKETFMDKIGSSF